MSYAIVICRMKRSFKVTISVHELQAKVVLIQSRNNRLVVLTRTNLIGRCYFVTVLFVSWNYNQCKV